MKTSRNFSELKKPNELVTQFLDDRLALKIKQAKELEEFITKAIADLNAESNDQLYAKIAEIVKDHSVQSLYLNLSKTQELLGSIAIQLDAAKKVAEADARDRLLSQIQSNVESFLSILKKL